MLSQSDRILLNTYARRYGLIQPGPHQKDRRSAIIREACDIVRAKHVCEGKISSSTDGLPATKNLFATVYRYINNNVDRKRTHRFKRKFKVPSTVQPRVTRSQTDSRTPEYDTPPRGSNMVPASANSRVSKHRKPVFAYKQTVEVVILVSKQKFATMKKSKYVDTTGAARSPVSTGIV